MSGISGGSRPLDKGGGPGLQKIFFRPFGPQFGPGPLPWVRHWVLKNFLAIFKILVYSPAFLHNFHTYTLVLLNHVFVVLIRAPLN